MSQDDAEMMLRTMLGEGWDLQDAVGTPDEPMAHVRNMQLTLFRARLSNDLPFYQHVWSRILDDANLWDTIDQFVKDVHRDYVSTRVVDTKKRLAARARTGRYIDDRQARRVRSDYLPQMYAVQSSDAGDQRRRQHQTIMSPGVVPSSIPQDVRWNNPFMAPPHQRHLMWEAIQLCPETFDVPRRLLEMWERAAGRRIHDGQWWEPKDPGEDQFALALMRILTSRIIPYRWFLSRKQDSHRDKILFMETRLDLPFAPYASLKESWGKHGAPLEQWTAVVYDGCRSILDAGYPEECLHVLDSYTPGLREDGLPISGMLHTKCLALHDLGRLNDAVKLAHESVAVARQENHEANEWLLKICILDWENRAPGQQASSKRIAASLREETEGDSDYAAVWKLVKLSAVCDSLGILLEAERCLDEADGRAGTGEAARQIIREHDKQRGSGDYFGRSPGAPPPKARPFGGVSPSSMISTSEMLARYFEHYPEERPQQSDSQQQD